jgi:DNA-binding MarR family transcriptional regulator
MLDLQGSVGYDCPMDVRTSGTSKRTLAKQAWKPLARFFFETAKHRQQVFADSGLTPNDARALFVLDRTRGRSMSELADEWLCDASNATWIVDRLEERGLAERRTIPTDRRVKLVVLTAKGDRTRNEMIRTLYEPPPELLELDLAELEALRDAVARLPLNGAS